MKAHFLLLMLLLRGPLLFSQSGIVQVLDSLSEKPLELSTIRFLSNDYTIFTDKLGKAGFKAKEVDRIEVSHLGYKTKLIHLISTDTIVKLSEQVNALPEIVIEKKSFKHKKILKPNKGPGEYFGFQFGTEHCSYIPNTGHKEGVITGISLYLAKLKSMNKVDRLLGRDMCKGCKVDYLASFRISFYEYDRASKKPGRRLNDEEIIAYPENKSGKFKIDLKSERIPLPQNGVCVGIEIINTRYNNPKTTFAFIGPTIGFYEYINNNNPQSWVRYRNEGWDFKNVITGYKRGRTSNALLIDLEIKM